MKYGSISLLLLLALAGCSKSGPSASSSAPGSSNWPGMEADLERSIKAEPNYYVFKSPADFDRDTKGLKWEDGSDLPPFAEQNAKRGGTLNEWLPDFPNTLRTLGPDSNGGFRSLLLDYMALALIDYHPDLPGRCYPELAEAWAADPARKMVFFRLDPDARWSDGVPVTADDFVFTFYMQRSKIVNDPWWNDFMAKTYSGITVYDSHHFAISVVDLRPDYIYRAGNFFPYPKHFFKDFGPGWEQRYNWRVTPTAGAYTILPGDLKQQVSVTLTHVPHWWAENRKFMKGRFNPEKLREIVVHDPDKAFEEFVHGDIDIFSLNDTHLWYDRLSNTSPTVEDGFTVKATAYHQIPPPDFGLWINESKPILSNHDVRLGIQYATDFALACREYFRGDAVQQQTANDGYGWDINPQVHPRPFDPQKARAAFARAGFTVQGPDGVLMNAQGQRLSFTITNNYRRYNDLLTILKQQALEAGLEFNIDTPDSTTAFEICEQKRHEIAFVAFQRPVEMFPRYWEYADSANAYDVPYLPDGSPNPKRKPKPDTNNLTCIAIPALDRIIHAYDHTTTMEQLKPLAAQAEMMIWEDAGWVPGFKLLAYHVGYRPWIKWPADFFPMQALDFEQYWTMWIDPDEQKADVAAHAAGRDLPKQILVYPQHKEP